MSVFSERLKSILLERGVTQAQLTALTGIPKSAISQYLSDKFKPKQERVYLISRALDISPAWLTGYADSKCAYDSLESPHLSPCEYSLVQAYRTDADFKRSVDALLGCARETYDIFRAAKSGDGTVAPSREEITAGRLMKLKNAPLTDEDL